MTEGIHYSKELEFGILGACLLEKDAIGRMYGLIDADSFHYFDHQTIYTTLLEMYDGNLPIDHITVWQKLVESGVEMKCGTKPEDISYYLTRLSRSVVSSANIEYHCHLLKTMWRKRELEILTQSGIDGSDDVMKQITRLTDSLQNIRGGETKKDWYDMTELMYGLMVHQQKIAAGDMRLITTGLKSIDQLNGGFGAGQMIIIGARPSVGKSALMGKMAIAMAKKGHKVGIISLEMNNTDIAARLASLETDVEFNVIYRNLFKDEKEHKKFYDILSTQSIGLPIKVSDKTKVDINEIKAKLTKMKYQFGCDCLMVDYLQLVDSFDSHKNANREQEVAKISRGLKLLAMEAEIPIIVLTQLNRAVTGRSGKDRYPKLSDIRESGSIEQDADIVMMLHRDYTAGFTEDENGNSTQYEADLIGLKWRNGSPFHLKLDFDPPKMKFNERNQTSYIPARNNNNHEDEDAPF